MKRSTVQRLAVFIHEQATLAKGSLGCVAENSRHCIMPSEVVMVRQSRVN